MGKHRGCTGHKWGCMGRYRECGFFRRDIGGCTGVHRECTWEQKGSTVEKAGCRVRIRSETELKIDQNLLMFR